MLFKKKLYFEKFKLYFINAMILKIESEELKRKNQRDVKKSVYKQKWTGNKF